MKFHGCANVLARYYVSTYSLPCHGRVGTSLKAWEPLALGTDSRPFGAEHRVTNPVLALENSLLRKPGITDRVTPYRALGRVHRSNAPLSASIAS